MELGSRKFRQLGFVVAVSGAIDGVLNLGAGIQTLLRLGSIHGNEGTTHQVFGVFPRWNSRRQHHNKEPWLIGLISFHVFLLLVSFLSRKNINFQMCLFLLALGGVYLAERLNRILAANWTSFSGQNYFDLSGVFLSVVWYGPLLVIAILILLLLAYVVAVRYEGLEFDMQMVEFDANSLYTAREKKIDTDEKTFIRIFSERSRAHLAVLLHKAMKGMGTNDSTLIRVIVTRTEIDMQYINAAYHKKYGK